VIIPLPHERTTVRTVPWISFIVIALCALLFVAGRPGTERAEREVMERQVALLDYLLQRPYLEPDPRFMSSDDAALVLGAEPRLPPPGVDQEAERAELDRLTGEWLASLRNHPAWKGGLVPAKPTASALVTYMFLHGGWLHLIFNMVFLYLTAPFVEDDWGHTGFAVFYLGAGIVAGGGYALLHPDMTVPLIGASGAVAGVMGAFLVEHGRTKLNFLLFLGIMVATFTAPAWIMLPLWFLGELFAALNADPSSTGGGVAYWAHVWGFVSGIVVGGVVRRRRAAARPIDDAAHPPEPRKVNPVLERVQSDLARGVYPRAWQALEAELRRRPADLDVAVALWDLAVHLDRTPEVTRIGQLIVRTRLADRDPLGATDVTTRLLDHAVVDPTTDTIAVRVAEGLAPRYPEDSAAIIRRIAATRVPTPLLARMARVAVRIAPDLGAELRALALTREDLDDGSRSFLAGSTG